MNRDGQTLTASPPTLPAHVFNDSSPHSRAFFCPQDDFLTTARGNRIRYICTPAARQPGKATIVFFHGCKEHSSSYQELIAFWKEQNCDTVFIDMPGHGSSTGYAPKGAEVLHERTLDDAAPDIHEVMERVVLPLSRGRPLINYSHSMGGQIAAEYLQDHPGIFDAAIFSDPMLNVGSMGLPPALRPKLVAAFRLAARAGWGDLAAPVSVGHAVRFMFNHAATVRIPTGPSPEDTPRESREKEIFAGMGYQRHPSFNWVLRANERGQIIAARMGEIHIPVLLGSCRLKPSNLVLTHLHDEAGRRMRNVRIEFFPTVLHNLHLARDEDFDRWMKMCAAYVNEQVGLYHRMVPGPGAHMTADAPTRACA